MADVGRTPFICIVVISCISFQLAALPKDCPSALVLFSGSPLKAYGEALLSESLASGGANLVYAERAQEVTQQYVVQFHETLTNTRSGKMSFTSNLRGGSFSQRELATTYAGVLAAAEQYKAGRGTVSHTSATLSAREYSEFQRQTGFLVVDYGEETEYTDWYNALVTDREQRAFWEITRTWNADILLLGTIEVVLLGRYGGLITSRAVVSLRVIDVRGERPGVIRSLAVVTNAIDLSETAASQRALSSAMERVAEELTGTLPCYSYVRPPTLQVPLGAVGLAVVDVRADWLYADTKDRVRRIVEAAVSKYRDFAFYTRTDLEAVLAEQRFGLSGLVENPVEAGRLAGVRYLLLPTITELDSQDQHYYIDVPILRNLRVTIRNMRVGLFLSLIDAQSGQIIWSSEKAASAVGLSILGIEFNMSPLDQFRNLAGQLLSEMYQVVIRKG